MLKAMFEQHADEYLKFDHVTNKLSNRPDLHAFIVVDRLNPQPEGDYKTLLRSTAYDEVWFEMHNINEELLTSDVVLELTRCGIRYSDGELSMFV